MYYYIDMENKIDIKEKGINLYASLEKFIVEQINTGNYPPGSSLPTEKWYCDTFNLSRVTVRKAINDLVDEGIILREKGKSPIVPLNRYNRNFNQLTGFSEQLIAEGHIPSASVKEFKTINVNYCIAQKLGIREGDTATYVKRVRFSDGVPIAIQEIYLNPLYSRTLTLDDLTYHSLYTYLEKKGVAFNYSDQTIRASIPNAEARNLLQLDLKTPVFEMERTTFHKNGDIIEYVKTVCDSNKYNVKIRLYR